MTKDDLQARKEFDAKKRRQWNTKEYWLGSDSHWTFAIVGSGIASLIFLEHYGFALALVIFGFVLGELWKHSLKDVLTHFGWADVWSPLGIAVGLLIIYSFVYGFKGW